MDQIQTIVFSSNQVLKQILEGEYDEPTQTKPLFNL